MGIGQKQPIPSFYAASDHCFVVMTAEKQATQLKIGDKFYIAGGIPKQELRCCGYLENGVVLYEFTDTLKFTNVCRLNPDISVFIKKEN